MHKRKLGQQGLEVSALGLGCMGMSYVYGHRDDAASINVLRRAVELGITFWDTAEVYGPFCNEQLLGRVLKEVPRQRLVLATKFAWRFGPHGREIGLDSSPAQVRRAIDGSLKRLGTDYIDLYYQHRLDPAVPIEETVGALAELVQQGKVRYIGLSEVGPGIVRRAHAVHPLSAVQSEFSLWERGVEDKLLPVLRELGIGFVAYSPMGRGFLAGKIRTPEDLEPCDWRRKNPRFLAENLSHNFRLVSMVNDIARAHDATPAQVALAWILGRGGDLVPIPGTKHLRYLEENAQAAGLKLSEEVWADLDRSVACFKVAGERYQEEALRFIDSTE
ncbi:oxidoreductase, aldo/keto reductase family [Citrifermentans bemidjiense Bem]|uniref:Oxidoreductase, aldo/keto reductase family n=1 Tax=Citrifermentans bemidjiense (strain ATCC BAA-1014 / DSM 16622 / JCM 12645 / Bem) TaxID=404380 RepID=B5EIN2_CITBB|nr:aldo/keto reductase [Citrifermentans bemidjiense]ACH38397.1 oxidoreductase, aldo/keto reductase family [Citrifermentans bemidjiense Bem]